MGDQNSKQKQETQQDVVDDEKETTKFDEMNEGKIDEEIKKIKEDIKKLHSNEQEMKEQIKKLDEEKQKEQQLQDEVKKLSQQKNKLRDQHTKLEREIKARKEENSTRNNQKTNIDDIEIFETIQNIEMYEKANTHLRGEVKEFEKKIQELQKKEKAQRANRKRPDDNQFKDHHEIDSVDKLYKLAGKDYYRDVTISMNNQLLEKDHIIKVTDCLSEMLYLKKLNFSLVSNNVTTSSCEEIAKVFKLYEELEELKLFMGQNYLKAEGANSITESIKGYKNLKTLFVDMESNQIEDEQSVKIFQNLQELKTITHIELKFGLNKIASKGTQAMNVMLKDMNSDGGKVNVHKIQNVTIDMRKNNITKEGCTDLLKVLQGMNSLLYCTLNLQTEGFISDEKDDQEQRQKFEEEHWCLQYYDMNMFKEFIQERKRFNFLSIDLSNHNIGNEGAEKIKDAIILRKDDIYDLKLLLHHNGITEGIQDSIRTEITQAISSSKVTYL